MLLRAVTLSIIFAGLATASSAQERQWNFDQTDSDAYLVFGVPETDDVGLSLWCTKLSGKVSLFAPETDPRLKPSRNAKVTLDVNGTRFRYKGKTSANKNAETTSIEITLNPDDKLFSAMTNGDHIAVTAGNSRHVYPLVEVDFGTFIQLCRKP